MATPVYRLPLAAVYRVEDALAHMRALLAVIGEARPLAAFLPRLTEEAIGDPTFSRSAVAATLIAALELCRENVVGLEQTGSFAAIFVSPRPSPNRAPTSSRL